MSKKLSDEQIMAVIRKFDYQGHFVFIGEEGGMLIEPHTVSTPMSKKGAKSFARFLNRHDGIEAMVMSGREILADEVAESEKRAGWYR